MLYFAAPITLILCCLEDYWILLKHGTTWDLQCLMPDACHGAFTIAQ